MIKRELYMKRIRPFIGSDLVKVMTGIRRCGKSVMLELIKDELKASGVDSSQFISINFEDMRYTYLQTAQALHDEITKLASSIDGKIYLFFDEIQEVTDWEKCINSLRITLDCDVYITGSNAKLLSGELATYLGGRYVEFIIYPFSYIIHVTTSNFMLQHNICYRNAPISEFSGHIFFAAHRFEQLKSKHFCHKFILVAVDSRNADKICRMDFVSGFHKHKMAVTIVSVKQKAVICNRPRIYRKLSYILRLNSYT